tara:strand:- start:16630 stop:17373 length:744 start_codon:yes stop_codon:yes gene_type:complete
MFGMSDPNQTLLQLESYVKDGRLEMSEVMATQFTDMFLSKKKRDLQSQFLLVKGLRILCDVLLARGKTNIATASAKILIRERKKLQSSIKKNPKISPEMLGPISEDFRRCANIFAHAKKHRAAKRFFSKSEKNSPGNIAVAMEAFGYYNHDKTIIKRLINCTISAGPVIRANGSYLLQPINLPPVSAEQVRLAMQEISSQGIEQAGELAARIQAEIGAIERGEAAANARLQSALDSLKPKHDYYEYS